MEEEVMVIYLRDNSTSPSKMLVEVKAKDDSNGVLDYAKAFGDFVNKAKQFEKLTDNIDIYIGVWGLQCYFTMPYEFHRLIFRTEWSVKIDFND